jgi:hypothetical protein
VYAICGFKAVGTEPLELVLANVPVNDVACTSV